MSGPLNARDMILLEPLSSKHPIVPEDEGTGLGVGSGVGEGSGDGDGEGPG